METCNSCGSDNKLPKGCKNNGVCGTTGCNKLTVFDWLSNIHPPVQKEQSQYVEVRFKNDHKDYYINSSSLPLTIGDVVAVEASLGHDIGVISLTGELVKIQVKKKKAKVEELGKIYRKATQKDIEVWQNYRSREQDVMLEARRIAKGLGLQMKICDVEFQGDGSKVTLYYTSEGRVDFRQLIKDYAVAFRSKIDMKQIGYRQESAKVGGIGSCGRELCCATWLTDFRSVNTAAARYQQLSINPQKLAGQCGKLKCCLNFELDTYVDALSNFPSSQTILETEKGKAYCIKVDVFRKLMWFNYADNTLTWFPVRVEDVKEIIELNKRGEVAKSLEESDEKESPKVDIIEENSLSRFEQSTKKKKNKQVKKTNKEVNNSNSEDRGKTNQKNTNKQNNNKNKRNSKNQNDK